MNRDRIRTLHHTLLLVCISLNVHIHIHIPLHGLLRHRLLEKIRRPRGRPCGACWCRHLSHAHRCRVTLVKVHRQRRPQRGEVEGLVAHECRRSGVCAVRAEESRRILVLCPGRALLLRAEGLANEVGDSSGRAALRRNAPLWKTPRGLHQSDPIHEQIETLVPYPECHQTTQSAPAVFLYRNQTVSKDPALDSRVRILRRLRRA